MKKNSGHSKCDILNLILMLCMCCFSIGAILKYLTLHEIWSSTAMIVIHLLIVLLSLIAWKARMGFLFLPIGIVFIVLNSTATFSTVHTFYSLFLAEAIVALAGGFLSIILQIRSKSHILRCPLIPSALFLILLAGSAAFWGIHTAQVHRYNGDAQIEIWGVPYKFDKEECSQSGSLIEFEYETKAYATDERTVARSILVYLPADYQEDQQYDILYLMHGTGDNQTSWLQENPSNKRVLDHMIAEGAVKPLIVVTPTFYVEDDCADDLDRLTYSFAQELRQDLVPAVESHFSTYADGTDAKSLIASRDHRAFAGLSRGAVTMYHSALCGSLDYFSYFGAFSGSRTSAEYFKQTIQSEEFKDYPINYLYLTSGNMDFALPGQISDYQALLEIEPRLQEGENTSFDVFPMRYHSWGNWHISLYNFLQHLFK